MTIDDNEIDRPETQDDNNLDNQSYYSELIAPRSSANRTDHSINEIDAEVDLSIVQDKIAEWTKESIEDENWVVGTLEEPNHWPDGATRSELDDATLIDIEVGKLSELSRYTEQEVKFLRTKITSTSYDNWRRSILREVFRRMENVNVDLADRNSVAAFLMRLKSWSPERAAKFENNFDVLLGGESPVATKETTQNTDTAVVDKREDKKSEVSLPSQSLFLGMGPEGYLRGCFPSDIVVPAYGANIFIQRIYSEQADYCGSIVWIFKRTEVWSDLLEQELEDYYQLASWANSSWAILVSEVSPQDTKSGLVYKTMVVIKPDDALGVVSSIRNFMIKDVANKKEAVIEQPQMLTTTPARELAPKQSETLKDYARYYYDLGLNVTCISNTKNEFNSKAVSNYLKAPNHPWDDLWFRRQTPEEFNSYQWPIASGFGLATGFNNLLTIDMDNCSYHFVVQTLEVLGLPPDYEWVVLSGSKHGYHIYVFVENLLNNFRETAVVRLFPYISVAGLVKKVELLIRLHSILPPSIHPTQNLYEFVNNSRPAGLPVYIKIAKINAFIDRYFDSAKQENKKTYKKEKRIHIQEVEYLCPNKPHSWREAFFGCSLCIAESERRSAENARILLEEQEERRTDVERNKQEALVAYVILRKEIESMPQYEDWRQAVFEKLGRRCAICGSIDNLEVDHRYQSFYAITQRYKITNTVQAYGCAALWDVNNGAPLCKTHHDQTPSSIYRASKL